MKLTCFGGLALAAGGLLVSGSTSRVSDDLRMMDALDEVVQARFADPGAQVFGMSRQLMPGSLGEHFLPAVTRDRDFQPATQEEKAAISALESNHVEVGFYLFGRAVASSESTDLNYRALKGPGAMTAGTPRPSWYPRTALAFSPPQAPSLTEKKPDTLPDWQEIYPLARKAMRSFVDGGNGFETEVRGWEIAARPVLASQARCVTCHEQMNNGSAGFKLHEPVGGVLYAFRRRVTG